MLTWCILRCFDFWNLFPSCKFLLLIFEFIFFVLDIIISSMIIMELKLKEDLNKDKR